MRNESLNTISKIIEAEMLLQKDVVSKEYEEEIAKLKNEIEKLKQEKEDVLKIKTDDSKEYYNLNDFCRVQKSFLHMDASCVKQFLFQRKVLTKNNGVYCVAENQSNSKEIDGEIYISYNYIRGLLTTRSLIMLGDNSSIDTFVEKYKANNKTIIEQLSNMVLIDYKQSSYEFRNCKGSTYLEMREK